MQSDKPVAWSPQQRSEWWKTVWKPEWVHNAASDASRAIKAHLRTIGEDPAKSWPLTAQLFPRPDFGTYHRLSTLSQFPPRDAIPEEWSTLLNILALRARTEPDLRQPAASIAERIEARIAVDPDMTEITAHTEITETLLRAFVDNNSTTPIDNSHHETRDIRKAVDSKPTTAYMPKHEVWKRGYAKLMRLENDVLCGDVDYFGQCCTIMGAGGQQTVHDYRVGQGWDDAIELLG